MDQAHTRPHSHQKAAIFPWGMAVVIYVCAALALTWPMARHLTTHLLAESKDTPLHFWNCWWLRDALRHGASLHYTRLLFHPLGTSLVTHNISWGNGIVFVALSPLFGDIGAYNASLILNLALCGLAAFALAYYLTRDLEASLVGGLVYQSWPYRLSQLGHPNLSSTHWLPVLILFILIAIGRRKVQWGLPIGVALALVGYTRWQLLIPAAISGGIVVLFALIRRRLAARTAGALVLGAVVGALLLLPPAWLLAQELRSNVAPAELIMADPNLGQVDGLGFVTPPERHVIVGSAVGPAYDRYYAHREGGRYPAYIGLVAALLALVGLTQRHTDRWTWLCLLVVYGALALGPRPYLNGKAYDGVPTLYRVPLLRQGLRIMREPGRFALFAALPMCVLGAYGVQALSHRLDRTRGERLSRALPLVAAALVLVDTIQVPIPLYDVPRPSSDVAFLASEEAGGAVLNLPIDRLQAKRYMFAQTVHGRPLAQGHLSRIPVSAYAFIDADPWLAALREFHEMDPWIADVSGQLGLLKANDIAYVVLNKDAVGRDRIEHWQRYLPMTPRHESSTALVYGTAVESGRDYVLLQELAPGIGPVRVHMSAEACSPGQLIEVDVAWGTTDVPGADLDVTLSLVAAQGDVAQEERFEVSSGAPTSTWAKTSLRWGYYVLHVAPHLAPGPYTVMMRLEGARGSSTEMEIGGLTLLDSKPSYGTRAKAKDVDAVFGDQMRLVEYRLDLDGGDLDVDLYWRAEKRMRVNYKVFVHVFDPDTGQPAAQDDAMPRRWAYPTRFWWPGERVEDRFTIELDGVPPGRYGVAIGVYAPETGARLPVTSNPLDLGATDGRLVLDDGVEIAP